MQAASVARGQDARIVAYFVVPVVVSVLLPIEPDAAPAAPEAVEPMSVLVPVLPVVPDAPIEVPLPVLLLAPAVVSVLGVVVPIEPVPLAVLLVESLGVVVVEGIVLEVDVEVSVEDVADSSFFPQALRDRAAIRARAAHCAIGDLIIRNSLRFRFEVRELTAWCAACGSL